MEDKKINKDEKVKKSVINKEVVISDELFFNIVKDFEKKNISTEDKGRFIQSYLDKYNISARQLARMLNIPNSTFHDWISQRQKIKYYEQKQKIKEIEDLISTDNIVMKRTLSKVVRNIGVFTLANRLYYLLSKTNDLDEKEINMLLTLKNEIEKIKLRLKV